MRVILFFLLFSLVFAQIPGDPTLFIFKFYPVCNIDNYTVVAKVNNEIRGNGIIKNNYSEVWITLFTNEKNVTVDFYIKGILFYRDKASPGDIKEYIIYFNKTLCEKIFHKEEKSIIIKNISIRKKEEKIKILNITKNVTKERIVKKEKITIPIKEIKEALEKYFTKKYKKKVKNIKLKIINPDIEYKKILNYTFIRKFINYSTVLEYIPKQVINSTKYISFVTGKYETILEDPLLLIYPIDGKYEYIIKKDITDKIYLIKTLYFYIEFEENKTKNKEFIKQKKSVNIVNKNNSKIKFKKAEEKVTFIDILVVSTLLIILSYAIYKEVKKY